MTWICSGIFTYIYHKFKPHVGKYASPMDPMGLVFWWISLRIGSLVFITIIFHHHLVGILLECFPSIQDVNLR